MSKGDGTEQVGKVTCLRSSDDRPVSVDGSELQFRPSAYAVVVQDGFILLVKTPDGRYFFPGGAMHEWETAEQAAVREVREETGLYVRVGLLIHFVERFVFYDPDGSSWHCLLFFFLACPVEVGPRMNMLSSATPTEGQPEWVGLSSLRPEDFKEAARDVFRLIKRWTPPL